MKKMDKLKWAFVWVVGLVYPFVIPIAVWNAPNRTPHAHIYAIVFVPLMWTLNTFFVYVMHRQAKGVGDTIAAIKARGPSGYIDIATNTYHRYSEEERLAIVKSQT